MVVNENYCSSAVTEYVRQAIEQLDIQIEQIVAQQAAIAHIGQTALGSESLTELFDEACALASRVLEAAKVDLYLDQQAIDTTTPAGRMFSTSPARSPSSSAR